MRPQVKVSGGRCSGGSLGGDGREKNKQTAFGSWLLKMSRFLESRSQYIMSWYGSTWSRWNIQGGEEPMSFTIDFCHRGKTCFCNKVLTKTQNASDPDDSDPFPKGPEAISSTGWQIYWKKRNNVTVKTIKQEKSEGHGSVTATRRKVPSYCFLSCSYPSASPKGRVVFWIGIFFFLWMSCPKVCIIH